MLSWAKGIIIWCNQKQIKRIKKSKVKVKHLAVPFIESKDKMNKSYRTVRVARIQKRVNSNAEFWVSRLKIDSAEAQKCLFLLYFLRRSLEPETIRSWDAAGKLWCCVVLLLLKPGVGKLRPKGHMWPLQHFHLAHQTWRNDINSQLVTQLLYFIHFFLQWLQNHFS